jgi:hypothetical protein
MRYRILGTKWRIDFTVIPPEGYYTFGAVCIAGILMWGMAIFVGRDAGLAVGSHNLQAQTRPVPIPDSEVVAHDVPTDREKIPPVVAQSLPSEKAPIPRQRPDDLEPDPGVYMVEFVYKAYRSQPQSRKCVPVFEWPEVCNLPWHMRKTRPVRIDLTKTFKL